MKTPREVTAAILIKNMRAESKYSLRGLAQKMGISNQLVSRWETEKERVPLHRVIAIGNLCGYSEREIRQRLDKSGQYVDYMSECKSLISMMDEEQLKALHTIMLSLVYK